MAPTGGWQVDVLGKPYYAETIELPGDDEGDVVATLVRRRGRSRSTRAVLHVHGFADYFFQTPAADYWLSRGYDFYALDLRKYGRSLLPHQTPNFTTDLADYYPELDEAFRRLTERDGHDHVVMSGHSTGGLVVPLWLEDQAVRVAGVVLNSPWLDLHGSLLLRTATDLLNCGHNLGRCSGNLLNGCRQLFSCRSKMVRASVAFRRRLDLAG